MHELVVPWGQEDAFLDHQQHQHQAQGEPPREPPRTHDNALRVQVPAARAGRRDTPCARRDGGDALDAEAGVAGAAIPGLFLEAGAAQRPAAAPRGGARQLPRASQVLTVLLLHLK